MKHSKIYFQVLVFAGILANFTCTVDPQKSKQAQEGKTGQNRAIQVQVQTIQTTAYHHQISTIGSLIALDQTMLSAEASGKIIFLNLPEGKTIEKGQLLMKLNDSELKAQLAKLDTQESLAIEKEKRKKKSLEIQGISKDEYEMALSELQIIQAEKKILLSRIQKTEMRAPFRGILGLRNVSEGAYIREGEPVISLVKIDPIGIEFSVPEHQSYLIKNGLKVSFTTDGLNDTMQAITYASEPFIDANDRSLKVRARFNNPQQKLKPGAFVKVEFSGYDKDQGVFIPNEALIPILKGYKVFILKNGKAKEVIVQTGERDETKVLIRSGLTDGDSLITSGIMRLKEGVSVESLDPHIHE
ncbi:MAG: efflux RND transporter periplasmic adaptor subunit [Saprospiraceae bacterium]|nr:efflux RND transporter periplasmic adaptor subunit [Saprospiraceae bacterium]